jgi:GSCFA family.
MNWFTSFETPPASAPISHKSKILSMGSCFAQVVGSKLESCKFDVLTNPFGTIFHPKILNRLLDHALFNDSMDESGVLERDGLYFHYEAHSDLVGKSIEELRQKWNKKIQETHEYLSTGTHLILTFGTAWIYEHQNFGSVANCHKQPQKIFEKKLSSMQKMLLDLEITLGNISRSNPNLKFILTVSPVRHIKDGIPGNSN